MDIAKQYIAQSITAASNNLRLNTQKIEVVALLREFILNSDNLEEDIRRMKKVTEFSTLAIRLSEIYNYLFQGHVDFFKLSEKFKEHSQYLIKDLSHMLEMVSPAVFKQVLNKIKEESKPVVSLYKDDKKTSGEQFIPAADSIQVDLSKRRTEVDFSMQGEYESPETKANNKLKEELILEDEKVDEDLFFQNFEEAVLKPIKPMDAMLKQLSKNEVSYDELNDFAEIMKKNGEISAKIGFDIIANMHNVIAKSLLLIKTKSLMPGKEVIESVRACLIVIVAVVRGKEVDITNYLNKAEEFGRKIQSLKIPPGNRPDGKE